MNIDDYLSKDQQKKLIEKSELIYDDELAKSKKLPERLRFSKNIRNHLDIYINELYKDGVMFYGFKLVRPHITSENPKMWYYTHLQTEYLMTQLRDEVELIEFCYLSLEKKVSENTPCSYGIIGVRTLVGDNSYHLNEMKKVLYDNIEEISIKSLKTVKSIKKYWNFVIKENNFRFHRFIYYSNYYQDFYCSISDLELQYDDHYAFRLDGMFECKNPLIKGIESKMPSSKFLIKYFIYLYFFNKNYRIFGDKIFSRNENSRFSWCMITKLNIITQNYVLMFDFLKELYPQQLRNFDITKLCLNDWDFVVAEIKKNNDLLIKLDFDYNFIEFEDGIFDIKEKTFINFSEISDNLDFDIFWHFPVKYQKINSASFWFQVLAKNCSNELFSYLVDILIKESIDKEVK